MNLKDLLIPISTIYNKYIDNNHIPIIQIQDYLDVPNIDFDVIILGYCEDRNSDNLGAGKAAEIIREQLYTLYSTSQLSKIIDVGNCMIGKTVKESYIILQETIKILEKYNKPIIVIGGTQESDCYIAKEIFKNHDYPTYTTIDSKIDEDIFADDFSNTHYLKSISKSHKNTRIINIGNQENASHVKSFEWFKSNYFPLFRLGNIFSHILNAEPLIRDAHIVSFDIRAVRYSDCPAKSNQNSIGLYSENACQLAWYAGYSPKMQVFHLSELVVDEINKKVSSLLAAQIVWHVLDGISQRKPNSLVFSAENYKCYYVKNSFLEQDLRFFEHFSSQQLWVEIPLKDKSKKRIIPCSNSDYQDFMSDNLSEFWLMEFNRVYQK